jgi:phosphatidylinositol alpha-mannosyltransferase
MKIAMVSPYDFAWPGGVNAHVSQLSTELRQRGHDVTVIAPQTSAGDEPRREPSDGFIPMGRPVPLWAGGSTARVTLSWWLWPRIRLLMAREQFDLVHVHEPLAPILPLMILHHSRAVNVGTFHAFSDKQQLYRWSRFALRSWHSRLHGRIAVSEAARTFVAPHFPQRAYRVIPNGIDYQRFADAMPFPELRDGKRNVLFVGRKDERKGLRYLLEAFLLLLQCGREVRLIVVGPGEPDRICSSLISAINDSRRDLLRLVGAVSDDDLPRYYASADVFCSPATGGESFGIVLLEAMAAGAPVVASDIDGYRDVVTGQLNGLLVSPREPWTIADAIVRLIDNPDLAKRLSGGGKQVAQVHRWQRVAAEVEDYYQHCMEEANRGDNAR